MDGCQKTMLHNDTWGRERGRFVDKVGVKHILRRWMEEDEEFKSLGMKIPKTLEVITRSNATAFTLDVLRKLPQPYIIKTSHGSGEFLVVLRGPFMINTSHELCSIQTNRKGGKSVRQ